MLHYRLSMVSTILFNFLGTWFAMVTSTDKFCSVKLTEYL